MEQIKKSKKINSPVKDNGKNDTKTVLYATEYKNLEINVIIISEPVLVNILKSWEEKRERLYQIKKKKIEKVSILLSLFGIDITLWSTYYTSTFNNDFPKALYFLIAVSSTIALIVFAILTCEAYHVKEENLCLDELIKSIEKRTE